MIDLLIKFQQIILHVMFCFCLNLISIWNKQKKGPIKMTRNFHFPANDYDNLIALSEMLWKVNENKQ